MKRLFIVIGVLGGILVCSTAGQSDLEMIPFDVVLWRSVLGILLVGIGFFGAKYFGITKKGKIRHAGRKISAYDSCPAKKTA